MLIAVDAAAAEPLYLQIRNQIVAGIATGQLEPGQSLPSVRSLASDLGINLHTVNKAYAVLRDEGYVRMRGRAGAVIADPAAADRADADASAQVKMEDDLFKLALAFRARGGALGAMGRYGLGLIPLGGELPLMTLLINFLGSVAIGAIVETSELAAGALSREAVLFLKVGLCGGFTTFSTFSLETLELIEGGQYAIAGAYALVSVVLCVAGVLVGKVLARALMPTG